MKELFAPPPGRLQRITAIIIFVLAGIILAVAVFGYFQQRQLLEMVRNAEQATLPDLLAAQHTARNLDLLHYNGEVIAFSANDAHRRQALADAQSLARHPSLREVPRVGPLVDESLTLLMQLATDGGNRSAELQHWQRLSPRFSEASEFVAAEAARQVQSEAERIEAMTRQSYFRVQLILAAMALLILFVLYLRRCRAATVASPDESAPSCRRLAADARMHAHDVESALRHHDHRFKELFDAFSDAVFIVDVAADGSFVHSALNPVAKSLVGDVTGRCVEQLFPADAAMHTAHYRRCVETGVVVNYAAEIVLPDGSTSQQEITLVPLPDTAGNPPRIAGIFRDVSERLGMENRLRDAAAQLRAFLDNLPDPAWIKGPDSRYLAVNPAFVRQVESRASEDIVSRLDLDFLPEKVARANLAHDVQVMVSGSRLCTEESVTDSNGQETHFEVIRSPLRDGDGKIVGTVGIARDVTKRVRALSLLEARERAFRSLAENIPDNIGRYTPEARFTYASPRLERTLKLSQRELIGKTPQELCPDGRLDDYQKQILTVAKSGEDREMEITVRQADGTTQYRRIRFVAERDGNGRIVGVLAIGADITPYKRIEEALRASEREFRTLAENLPDNIVRYDADCRVTYFNPAVVSNLQPSFRPVLGKKPDETHPGDEFVLNYQRLIERVILTGEESELEVTMPRSDGCVRTDQVRIVAECTDDGKIVGALAIGRDISERLETERTISNLSADWAATLQPGLGAPDRSSGAPPRTADR